MTISTNVITIVVLSGTSHIHALDDMGGGKGVWGRGGGGGGDWEVVRLRGTTEVCHKVLSSIHLSHKLGRYL